MKTAMIVGSCLVASLIAACVLVPGFARGLLAGMGF